MQILECSFCLLSERAEGAVRTSLPNVRLRYLFWPVVLRSQRSDEHERWGVTQYERGTRSQRKRSTFWATRVVQYLVPAVQDNELLMRLLACFLALLTQQCSAIAMWRSLLVRTAHLPVHRQPPAATLGYYFAGALVRPLLAANPVSSGAD